MSYPYPQPRYQPPMPTAPPKSPGVGAIPSLLMPGAGHLYSGNALKGVLWFLAAGFAWFLVFFIGWIFRDRSGLPRGDRRLDSRSHRRLLLGPVLQPASPRRPVVKVSKVSTRGVAGMEKNEEGSEDFPDFGIDLTVPVRQAGERTTR